MPTHDLAGVMLSVGWGRGSGGPDASVRTKGIFQEIKVDRYCMPSSQLVSYIMNMKCYTSFTLSKGTGPV